MFIDELFASFERWTPLYLAAINLYQGDQPILEQSAGIPGVLALTEGEFIELQRAWEQHGLPRDLYYVVTDQHTAIEPVERYGGVVRVARRYTPRQWAAHSPNVVEPLHVPNEEERKQEPSPRQVWSLWKRSSYGLQNFPSRARSCVHRNWSK